MKEGRAPEEARKSPPAPAMRMPAARSATERILFSTVPASFRGIIERPSSSRETPSLDVRNFAAEAKYGWMKSQIFWTLVAMKFTAGVAKSRTAVNGASIFARAELKNDGVLGGTVLILYSSWLVHV